MDENVRKKADSFIPGEGLSLANGVLTVTLNTELFKVVTSLPTTPAASDANKIFLVLDSSNPGTGNIYVEYLYTEQGWEEIGRRQVDTDLEPYLKKSELTATISSTSFAIQKAGEQLGVLVFGSNDFQTATGAKSLNVSLKDILAEAVTSGMYKLSIDKKGRVTGYTAIQLSDLTALGVAKQSDLETTNSNLATEVTNRQNAITGVNNTITSTKNALEAADTALGGRIDSANSSISSEANTRETEDGKLQTQITTLAGNMVTGDSNTLAAAKEDATSKVSGEATARENADTALSNRITTLETALADRPIMTAAEVTAAYNEIYS
ncbi:MAG: hypothetical protein NC131_06230 [Roseburia sp.]|nr:hypothetical protein [Roseburia sp.]